MNDIKPFSADCYDSKSCLAKVFRPLNKLVDSLVDSSTLTEMSPRETVDTIHCSWFDLSSSLTCFSPTDHLTKLVKHRKTMRDVGSLKELIESHQCTYAPRLSLFIAEIFSLFSDDTVFDMDVSYDEPVSTEGDADEFFVHLYFDDNVHRTQLKISLSIYSFELTATA